MLYVFSKILVYKVYVNFTRLCVCIVYAKFLMEGIE